MSTVTPSDSDTNILEIRSVLLLDDDAQLADALKELLEAHDFVVTTAKNGVEGLHEIMAFDFDVIVCDLLMPTMPGDMFYLAVQRTKPQLCDRFVFITGHAGDSKVADFLSRTNGVALYKPVKSADLLAAIQSVLQKTRESQGTRIG